MGTEPRLEVMTGAEWNETRRYVAEHSAWRGSSKLRDCANKLITEVLAQMRLRNSAQQALKDVNARCLQAEKDRDDAVRREAALLDRLRELEAGVTPEQELPGMWSNSDLSGGAADTHEAMRETLELRGKTGCLCVIVGGMIMESLLCPVHGRSGRARYATMDLDARRIVLARRDIPSDCRCFVRPHQVGADRLELDVSRECPHHGDQKTEADPA